MKSKLVILSLSAFAFLFLTSSFYYSYHNKPVIDTDLNGSSFFVDQQDYKKEFKCPQVPTFEKFINYQNKYSNNISESQNNISLKANEYNITFDNEINSYQSPNRLNNIRFIYSNNGFTAKARDNKISVTGNYDKSINKKNKNVPYWEVNLRLNSFSKDESNSLTNKFSGSKLITDNNTAFIEDDNLRINYINNEEGMRQDFIVKKKPEGNQDLKLELIAETKLSVIVSPDVILFKEKTGEDQLKYSGLKVWDANGRSLNAYFESKTRNENLGIKKIKPYSQKKKLQPIYIVVSDENATYPITVDPLSTSPNWTAESNQTSAQFGFSVATAGDVNGDGYSDVIIGANKYDNGQTDEGKVFVYYGSSTGLLNTSSWNAESNQANSEFGFSVATAGDVNGDGYSDIIVGANKYDSGQADEGKVFAYYGSAAGLSLISNWAAESNQAGALFGNSISTTGDVNGDGYSDIIIGAHLYDNGHSNEGRVYVYHGSSGGLSVTSNWNTEINQANAFFGYSVSTAGDVNGDGFSDVIIGAYLFDNGQSDEGKAFVYLGSSTGLLISSIWSVESDQSFANYGYSVSGAGDVNGDGYSDIIVGANKFDNVQTDEGKVFVYQGSSSGPSLTANWSLESDQDSANFGNCVATAGDVNGDGYCDVIIGASFYDSTQYNEGKAFVYNGSSAGLSLLPDWTGESNQISAAYGICVATAGDVNGDGFSDILIGANLYDNGEADEGRVYAYYGSASNLPQVENWSAESNQSNALFGWSVSTAGDVNGDGYGDVIVGAKDYNGGQSLEGRAYLYLGSSNGLSLTPSWTAEPNIGSYFGQSVSTAGDVNGDGFSDVIVGAPWLDSGQTDEGRTYVYLGSASGLSLTPNWTVEGNQANAHFGWSVATAGDVNGDGFSDVIIGAIDFDGGQTNEGKSFVYYGSSSGLSLIANWTAESDQASSHFGYSVSSAGDVNGDGYGDVIVGAKDYNGGQSLEGRAYLYLGSSNGLSLTPNWTAEPNIGSYFGQSVSTAGDVNGDGYSDVIVGAPWLDNGQTDEGRAYVYLGSDSGLSLTPNWTVEGNQANAHFGWSVATAGDVNGDGFSDVIIGAIDFDNGQSDEGRAYLYLGSSTGLSIIENWINESNQANANFGHSVSSAGDVNGDGFSDALIGSPYYNNGQTDEGRAYVYYGNGTGGKALVQQLMPSSINIVSAGGLTGKDGDAKLQIFARSPFGRSQGKIIYEYKTNGIPFSGNPITNSVSNSGAGAFSDLLLTGKNLPVDLTGLSLTKEYKWRARIQYKLSGNPFQKYGPWKYYNNYVPLPFAGFKARQDPQVFKSLYLTMLIEGLYNSVSNSIIQDTVRVYLRNSTSPYTVIDSSKLFLTTAGTGIFNFYSPPLNLTSYYIQLKHRNSIETWSKYPIRFVNSLYTYNFTSLNSQAYGNNLIQVDNSPVGFAIYSGDVNQDGLIDATDGIRIYNDGTAFLSGYVISDLNGDAFVDGTDMLMAFNNSVNFVRTFRP